jgi:hypothetical protein
MLCLAALLSHALLLAAITDGDKWIVLAGIWGFIVTALPALHYAIKVWRQLKGREPDMSQYVTRNEFNEAKAARDRQFNEGVQGIKRTVSTLSAAVTALAKEFHDERAILNRALGKVEGQIEAEQHHAASGHFPH